MGQYSAVETCLTGRNRNRWAYLLSLALILAQWGMLAHASSHLNPDRHGTPATKLCGECLSFAPLQNAVGGASTVVLAVEPPIHLLHDVESVPALPPRRFDAFRSRAPPAFL